MSREYHAAAAAYRSGDFAEAERTLKDLLERDDALHEARLLLVRLYLEQSRTEHARRVLHAALRRYPRHAASASLYAQVLTGLGHDHEAIDVMQAALPGARDDAAFHALLALLYQRTGLVRESVRSYRFALRLDPSRGDWWVGLGIVGEQSGDERLAGRAYREALQHPLDGALEDYVNLRLERGAVRGAAMTPSRERAGSGSW